MGFLRPMNKIILFSYNDAGEPTSLLIGAIRGELWVPATHFSCLDGGAGDTKPLGAHIKNCNEYYECDDNDQERILYWLKGKKPHVYMNLLNLIWDDPITISFKG